MKKSKLNKKTNLKELFGIGKRGNDTFKDVRNYEVIDRFPHKELSQKSYDLSPSPQSLAWLYLLDKNFQEVGNSFEFDKGMTDDSPIVAYGSPVSDDVYFVKESINKQYKMKKSELRKIIKEEISEMNFTGHGYDKDGGEFSPRETEFTRNTPARINQFIDKLDDLIDEYHAELYLKDGVFTGMEAMRSAALGPDTTED